VSEQWINKKLKKERVSNKSQKGTFSLYFLRTEKSQIKLPSYGNETLKQNINCFPSGSAF
jgi:hypothetical protein